MKNIIVIFNLLVFIIFYIYVFINNCKNIVNYSISDILCCKSAANSGIFAIFVVLGFA